mmetsp:Transcript_109643/g.309266  ORF Transcript_109643/g.309266 Transcript_109643/m.309266 type:complete len:92 (+) Transcript_109643:47-322(+)
MVASPRLAPENVAATGLSWGCLHRRCYNAGNCKLRKPEILLRMVLQGPSDSTRNAAAEEDASPLRLFGHVAGASEAAPSDTARGSVLANIS